MFFFFFFLGCSSSCRFRDMDLLNMPKSGNGSLVCAVILLGLTDCFSDDRGAPKTFDFPTGAKLPMGPKGI